MGYNDCTECHRLECLPTCGALKRRIASLGYVSTGTAVVDEDAVARKVARMVEKMIVGGRQWTEGQAAAAEVLFAVRDAIARGEWK